MSSQAHARLNDHEFGSHECTAVHVSDLDFIQVRSSGSCYGQVVADSVDIAADRYAALVAPVIERLVLAVVNLAIASAAGTSVRSASPADAMRMFGQLRIALLARPVTEEGLAAVYRYRDPADVQRDVEALRAAGLVERAGDAPSKPANAAG